MALQIVSAAEPIKVETIVLVEYSPPGLGKTSTAFTSESPLLLDTDNGSHRSAFRKDVVRPAMWEEIANITADDVKPYKTLVLDTAGRALDLLALDIIEKNPKHGRGGALTLRGFGELKSRFAAYLSLMRSFGMDIVLVAHSDEKPQGDDIIERLDMQGSSKQEVYKSADAMARLLIDGGKRYLSFSPTDTAFGKDPAGIGRVPIPDFNDDPAFLAKLIQHIKDTLNEASEEQTAAREALEQWNAKVAGVETPEELTALVKEAKTDRSKQGAVLARANEQGWTWDKEAKSFVAPEAEEEEAEEGQEPEPEPEPKAKKTTKTAAPKKEPEPKEDEAEGEPKLITEKQGKRLYAIAKGAGYSDDGLHAMLLDKYGLTSTKEITRDIYEEVCDVAADDSAAYDYSAMAEGDGEEEGEGEGQSGLFDD